MSEDYRQYRYDLLNRLTEVLRYQDGNLVTVARYGYDINSLRIYKEDGEGKTTHYVYDATGNRLETHTDETSSYYLFRGLRHVARRIVDNVSQEEVRHYYGTDHLGSTVLVTGDAGEVLWTGETNPFGDSVSGEGTGSGESERLKYTGKDFDEDAGLYYFNARWYDPGTGRFITEDPIRYGANWYGYANNNPLMYVDPTGLMTEGDGGNSNDIGDDLFLPELIVDAGLDIDEETLRYLQSVLNPVEDYYSESLNNYGLEINEIEILILSFLETGDTTFLDLVPDVYIENAFWNTTFDMAVALYSAQDPGRIASEVSQKMFLLSGAAVGVAGGVANTSSLNLRNMANAPQQNGARQTAMRVRVYEDWLLQTGNRAPLSDQNLSPSKFRNVFDTVSETGEAPEGYRGGRTFQNDGRGGGTVLPRMDPAGNPINYREWDVNPFQPGVNRGPERLVTGSDGSAWYTVDHYQTFQPLKY
jgi:RHS repeat-associated protein